MVRNTRVVLILVAVALSLFLWASAAVGMSIESHFAGPNRVLSLDYSEGTLAVGTDRGLFILSEGNVLRFDRNDGLPDRRIDNVVLADGDTMFIGPFGWPNDLRFYRAEIVGARLVISDVTGSEIFSPIKGAVAYGSEGSFWVGDWAGLKRFNGDSWATYEWPDEFPDLLVSGLLCPAEENVIWGLVYVPSFSPDRDEYVRGLLFRFEDGEWTLFDEIEDVRGLGLDSSLTSWCISRDPPSLWRFDAGDWEIISEEPVLGPLDRYNPSRLEFDESGALWAFGNDRLLKWANGLGVEITEASGIEFRNRWNHFFSCLKSIPPTTMMFGTEGYGLLIYDGQDFSRLCVDGLAGDDITCIIEDSGGAPNVLDMHTLELSTYRNGAWENLFVPWMSGGGSGLMDLEGALWFPARGGVARLRGDDVELYDSANSLLATNVTHIALDTQGSIWLSQFDYGNDTVVVKVNDGNWEAYSNRDCFESQYVFGIDVGPEDIVWFRHGEGFTTFDWETWRHLYHGDQLPVLTHINAHASFDLSGNVILWGSNGVFLGRPEADWDEIYGPSVYALQQDSEGTLWLGTSYEGLAFGNRDNWSYVTTDDGLSDDQVRRIMIDHNGDKWVGTNYGLNRVEDGGPAQQKFELSVEETPDGYLTVSGTFTNAGAVIPVLLWLACEYDDTLYYYPAWGPTPEGTKRVLGAYSIETEELLRLNTSILAPGDYTFYGGISLLGGMDLLIGARGAKIAIAMYRKE